MKWKFTEHAKERLHERYNLHPVADSQKLEDILDRKQYLLVKETVKNNVIIQGNKRS